MLIITDFDQILDLSGDNRRLDEDAPPAPIIAFEQSSQQTGAASEDLISFRSY